MKRGREAHITAELSEQLSELGGLLGRGEVPLTPSCSTPVPRIQRETVTDVANLQGRGTGNGTQPWRQGSEPQNIQGQPIYATLVWSKKPCATVTSC